MDAKQLRQVRETGEFDVESVRFAGQKHVWRVTKLLQKGTVATNSAFLSDCAKAVRFIVILARNRLVSDSWSVRDALNQILKALVTLADALVGLPHSTNGDMESKIEEERLKYAVAELDVLSPADRDRLSQFANFVTNELAVHASANNCLPVEESAPYNVPLRRMPDIAHAFKTPNSTIIDLRLFNSELRQRCTALLDRAIARADKLEWFDEFVHRLIVACKSTLPSALLSLFSSSNFVVFRSVVDYFQITL